MSNGSTPISANGSSIDSLVTAASDGTLTTTSLIVAEGTGVQHKNVLELVRDNLADFEEFGGVAFETRPFETAGGVQQRDVAILIEEHAALLMTYMRNNEVVRGFKKRLVKAFFELRRAVAINIPRTLPDALRAYAREVEAREAAELYAAELKPKADYVDDFVSSDDCIQFRSAANQLGVKEHALRETLTEKGWIYQVHIGRRFSKSKNKLVDEFEWRAYAAKASYFRLFPQHDAPRHHNNQLRQTLYITPAGLQAVAKVVAA